MIKSLELDIFSMLITQTVQVTLLIAAVWIVTRAFAKDRPHLAHALWMLVLIKCVTPPIWHSPASPFSWMTARHAFVSVDTIGESQQVFELKPQEPHSDIEIVTEENTYYIKPLSHFESKNELEASVPLITTNPTFHWRGFFVWVWIWGAGVGLLAVAIRFAVFHNWMRGRKKVSATTTQKQLDRLAKKLGIRRHVRLTVLDGHIGPAVLGLFRPTILLPAAMVNDKSENEIELLLAHELIHVRRGDLVWAMIQTLATSLFWFHPLVWLASRLVTRESERSCDEETVASLGCDPTSYARGLLDVLEQKNTLKHRMHVAPTLPGVRPVDITSARLERVMKLGNGSLKRTPIWIWCVMLIIGFMVLPGAAMVLGQEENNKTVGQLPRLTAKDLDETTDLNEAESVDHGATKIVMKEQAIPFISNVPYINRLFKNVGVSRQPDPTMPRVAGFDTFNLMRFDVAKILTEMQKQGLSEKLAKQKLLSLLPVRYPGKNGESSTKNGKQATFELTDGTVLEFGGDQPNIKIAAQTMFVLAEPEEMKIVEDAIQSMERFGTDPDQIEVNVRIVTLHPKKLAQLEIDWSMVDSNIGQSIDSPENGAAINHWPEVDNLLFKSSIAGKQPVSAVSYTQIAPMTLYSLIKKSKSKQIKDSLAELKGQQMSSPRVVTFNGQTASFKNCESRPFVVGIEQLPNNQHQPKIRIIEDGLTVRLRPRIENKNGKQFINLECVLKNSRVTNVETADIPRSKKQPLRVQIPEVETTRIESQLCIESGNSAVLSCQVKNREGEQESLLVFIDCDVVEPSNLSPVPHLSSKLNDRSPDEKKPATEKGETKYRKAEPDNKKQTGVDSARPKVDFVVRSTHQAVYTHQPRFIEAAGYRFQLIGNVPCNVSNEAISIAGDYLEIFHPQNQSEFFVSGDKVKIEMFDNGDHAYRFIGNANLKLGNCQTCTAKNLDWSSDNGTDTLNFDGDVQFELTDTDDTGFGLKVKAGKIKFTDNGLLRSFDNVTLQYQPTDGEPITVTGDHISFDPETGSIETQDKTSPMVPN